MKRTFTTYPNNNIEASILNPTTFSSELIRRLEEQGFGYILQDSTTGPRTAVVNAILYSAAYSKDPEFLTYLATQTEFDSFKLNESIAGNINTPADILIDIWDEYKDSNELIVRAVITNPNTPYSILETEAEASKYRGVRALAKKELQSR
jgi:hypothetical protein